MDILLDASRAFSAERQKSRRALSADSNASSAALVPTTSTGVTFRPGDVFNIEISDESSVVVHTLQIDSISANNFPEELVAEIRSSALPNKKAAIAVTRKSAIETAIRRKASTRNPGEIASPVTGMVVEINVKEGEIVQEGQQVFVMSAMKMETVVRASVPGRVQTVYAKSGDLVEAGDLLVETSESKGSKL